MQDLYYVLKSIFVAIAGYISIKLGILAPLFLLLFVSMIIDYILGIIAASLKGELNSKRGSLGILKKLGYIVAIAVSLIVDQIIFFATEQVGINISFICAFGVLTTIWLTLNELLSIIENLGRMGVPLPNFLKNTILILKKSVEKKGDKNE